MKDENGETDFAKQLTSDEYKILYQNEIDIFNNYINKSRIIVDMIDRFIVRGRNSDYDIDVVYIKEENSGRTVSRHSTKFSHTAMYGKYKYTFVANNQKFIIDVFKTNDYEHYTADIEIKSIDSGINMFEISVGRNGVIEASEEHRFGESDCIYISVGP